MPEANRMMLRPAVRATDATRRRIAPMEFFLLNHRIAACVDLR